MSIDITSDTVLSIEEARLWLGERLGRPPSKVAVRRWITCGVRGAVLESILVGGRRFTSQEAIERFIGVTSGGKAPTTTARRRREIERAEREADRIFGPVVGGGG